MARAGNHGRQIPRDRALLHRLYCEEGRTLVQIADHFGVTHPSVRKVLAQLGIPRRERKDYAAQVCKDCGGNLAPSYRRRSGGICKTCRLVKMRAWGKVYTKLPHRRPKVKALMKRWYIHGALRPTTETQWITKGRHLLRSTKRLLATGTLDPAASSHPRRESRRVRSSPTSCRNS